MLGIMRRRPIAPLALLFALLVGACGGSITSQAQTTLATSLAATNAARDGFIQWDEAHQLGIVDRATSRGEAEAQLKNYRRGRERVLKAFTIAYASIAAAAALLPLVQRGEKRETDLVGLVIDAATATKEVKTAIAAIRGDL